MQQFLVLVQEGEDEGGRWYFACDAEDVAHAEEQALDHSEDIRCIAVFQRVA